MYELNGIMYSDNQIIKVVKAKALDNYILSLEFNDGTIKEFDFKPLLKYEIYKPLTKNNLFSKVYVEYGVPTWDDDIDISADYLYTN